MRIKAGQVFVNNKDVITVELKNGRLVRSSSTLDYICIDSWLLLRYVEQGHLTLNVTQTMLNLMKENE